MCVVLNIMYTFVSGFALVGMLAISTTCNAILRAVSCGIISRPAQGQQFLIELSKTLNLGKSTILDHREGLSMI